MENPNFLKKFKGIGNAPEVVKAKERQENRTGEKVKGDFESLIQNYLNRFTEFKDHINKTKDGRQKERAIEKFKVIIMDKFITRFEDIPESYWKEKDEDGNMGPFFREINDQGLSGDWARMDDEKKEKYKREHAETLIENQKGSLEEWLDYFMDNDLSRDIPDYLKYWIFRSVTGLQEYEKPKDWDREKLEKRKLGEEDFSTETDIKTKGQFPRRSKNSLKKYPDLHSEALRYVADALVDKFEGKNQEFGYDIQEDEREKFKKYLEQENFAKLYGWAMESFNPIPEELLPVTEGKWVTYPKGTDVNEVVKKLKGKGTGLCIAGKGAASNYLSSGDLHIYYSNDMEGNPNFPRIAIHGKGDKIAEMRGIAYKQNLDPFMTEVAGAKCQEFQNGKEYQEKSEDMKRLTEIENKTRGNQKLNKDDLIFLYEIDKPIKYFGMNSDPRVEEIRKSRNIEEDASIIFECEPSQIAKSIDEINKTTKAYIGEWNPQIYQEIKKYPNIQHLYESFPDKKIFMMDLKTDPNINSPEKAEEVIRQKNIYLSEWGKNILYKTEFSQKSEQYSLVSFTVKELGLPNGATTEEIYKNAQELGLELCPAEVGPHLRLQYPGKEWMLIAMEQITARVGDPGVFGLNEDVGRLALCGNAAKSARRWGDDYLFVFLFRKLVS